MCSKHNVYSFYYLNFLPVLLLLASAFDELRGELVVNVKNKGGDVQVETIDANTTADIVSLQYQKTDGTFISQFIDFKSGIQVFRTLVLPEEERGQTQHQVMCFVIRYIKNEFISSDAMSKLRQKNPTAIRTPEDDRGHETHEQDLLVSIDKSHVISPHIFNICQEARDGIYARETDLHILSRSLGKDFNAMSLATKKFIPSKYQRCKDISDMFKPCACHYEICVGWYPCGLKYCRGHDSSGRVVSYRCGIKTCQKCRIFVHYVAQKLSCIWDVD